MPARRLSSPARVLLPTVALALFFCALSAANASAALPWAACRPTGFQCANLAVPLDRSGAVPGTVTLHAKRVPATSNPDNVAVVPLAGGPGQAALPLAEDFAKLMPFALTTRDLLVFDQRGTGRSGPLRCRALSDPSVRSEADASAGCATELGAARGFYTTPDSVADIEALRVAGGYSKLVLYGVSYGTKVAEEYAAQYPQNVEALVLDSVVRTDGPDPFSRSTLTAVPRVLNELCAGHVCEHATPSVSRDLTALIRRLQRHSLSARAVAASGVKARIPGGIRLDDVLNILFAGDLNPLLRSELPGSMHAALKGDTTPLARLVVRSEGLTIGYAGRGRVDARAQAHQATEDDISEALYLATTCEESPFAWTRSAGFDQRRSEIITAANQQPAGAFGPFDAIAALDASGAIPACLGWPDASAGPAPVAALPGVRTLILDGQMDIRTPIGDAQAVGASIPGAQVVEVPWTGHSTTTSDLTENSSCTQNALKAFFAGGTASPCAAGENPYPVTMKPPTRFSKVSGSSRTARTVKVVKETLNDARLQIIGDILAFGQVPRHVGGLRAGNVTLHANGTWDLNKYQYVPGVVVSGTVSARNIARVTVHGGGALAGTLRLAPGGGTTTGVLGGRRVRVAGRKASAASLDGSGVAFGGMTVAEALASAMKPIR
jgi:pimeloyl-ACP methyl ester carboxylesterase